MATEQDEFSLIDPEFDNDHVEEIKDLSDTVTPEDVISDEEKEDKHLIGDNDEEESEESEEEVIRAPKTNKKKATQVQATEEKETLDTGDAIQSFVSFLKDEGVISVDSVEGEGTDLLRNTIKAEIKSGIEDWKKEFVSNLTPKQQKLFGLAEAGVSEDLIDNFNNKLELYTSIKEDKLVEDIDLQKKIYSEYLSSTGFEKDEIKEMIEEAEDLGKLEAKAKSSLPKLIKGEEKKIDEIKSKQEAIRAAQEKQYQEDLKAIKNSVETLTEIVPGMRINDKTKQEVYNIMTQVVAEDEDGNPMNKIMEIRSKNPIAHEIAYAYYTSIGLFNLDEKGNFKPDFSKIKVNATTAVAKDLKNKLESINSFKSGGSPLDNISNDKDDNLYSALDKVFGTKK